MTDILNELKTWRDQLAQERTHRERAGEAAGVDVGMANRAIEEIERLRGEVAQLQCELQQR